VAVQNAIDHEKVSGRLAALGLLVLAAALAPLAASHARGSSR
jgi:hypothetical protein